ncbi:MAG: hypothetical protein WCG99_00435 [Candidatus Berkelbacteria bacterium]
MIVLIALSMAIYPNVYTCAGTSPAHVIAQYAMSLICMLLGLAVAAVGISFPTPTAKK